MERRISLEQTLGSSSVLGGRIAKRNNNVEYDQGNYIGGTDQ